MNSFKLTDVFPLCLESAITRYDFAKIMSVKGK